MEENKALSVEQVASGIVVNGEKEDKGADEFMLAEELLGKFGLVWTFRSVRYAMDNEHVTFAQLRSCVYPNGSVYMTDVMRSVEVLIKAGLVGSKQIPEGDKEKLENRAYDIMEEWAENGLHFSVLHLLMIDIMEERHFFMGNRDVTIAKHLVSKGLQKDLAMRRLIEDTQEKAKQIKAYAES